MCVSLMRWCCSSSLVASSYVQVVLVGWKWDGWKKEKEEEEVAEVSSTAHLICKHLASFFFSETNFFLYLLLLALFFLSPADVMQYNG